MSESDNIVTTTSNEDTGEMCSVYSKTKTSIDNMLSNEKEINIDVFRNILQLIKSDCNSSNETAKSSAMDMLDFIIEADIKNDQLQRELKRIAQGSNKELSSFLTSAFTMKIEETMAETPLSINLVQELSDWDDKSLQKVINSLCSAFEELKPEIAKKFFLDKVVPAMFNLHIKNEVRGALIELGFRFLQKVSIDDMLPAQVDVFIRNVINVFVKNLSDLREKEYPDWHKLWIFLIRFCGKKVHTSMELANKLLRLVEFAFRNNSYQQRLLGYDCWKEFIDNASLDLNHMCTPKQIKLLITPLKAKFSKLEVVISKRFDVFVYLLQKLQERSDLCLPVFLEFCYGPLDGGPSVSSKGAQAKSVSQLWGKSTAVLLAIIGHSHESDECISNLNIVQFEKPVINSGNIVQFLDLLLKSLKEVYVLLKEWCLEKQKLEIIKCSWTSVLKAVVSCDSPENRSLGFQVIVDFLENISKQSGNGNLMNVFIAIIYVTICFKNAELLNMLDTPVINCVLEILMTKHLQEDIADKIVQFVYTNIQSVCNKNKYIECFLNAVAKVPCTHNVLYVQKIWLMLELNDDFKTSINVNSETMAKFLMFGVCHLHDFEIIRPFLFNWAQFYNYMDHNGSSDTKNEFLQEVEVFFANNPSRFSNIISFLSVISQFESREDQEGYVSRLLKLCCMLLSRPDLSEGDVKKMCSVVITLLDWTLPFYNNENNKNLLENMCNCVKHLLVMHKYYSIYDQPLENCLKQLPDKVKSDFLAHLLPTLNELSENKEEKISSESKKILQILQPTATKSTESPPPVEQIAKSNPSPVFTVPQSRASRIASMSLEKSATPPKQSSTEENSIFKMFGKSPAINTPVQIKGSMLNKASPKSNSPKRAKKILKALAKKEALVPPPPPLEEDNTADFVQINTVVKIQPDKLNEHQKEMMKKRREDIPALYQDLTQSLSQDLFKTKENSSSNNSLTVEDKPQEKPENEVQVPSEDVKETNTESSKNVPEESVSTVVDNDSKKSDNNSKTDEQSKKKSRMELELARLQMDLVGGGNVLEKVATSRRTRSGAEKAKPQLRPRKETPKTAGKSRASLPSRAAVSSPKTQDKQEKSRVSLGALKESTPKRISFPESQKSSKPTDEASQPKSGRKRKQKIEPDDKFSEDIIESSQESFVNITSSPKRAKLQKTPQKQPKEDKTKRRETESTDEQEVIRIIIQDDSNENDENISYVIVGETVKTSEPTDSDKKFCDTQDTETCNSSLPKDISFVIGVEKPKKPELSDSEKIICNMDTASVLHCTEDLQSENKVIDMLSEISVLQEEKPQLETHPSDEDTEIINANDNCGTPIVLKQRNSLPTSPVNGDTPVKTNELLTDTMNISPIGSLINSEEETEPEEAHLSVNNLVPEEKEEPILDTLDGKVTAVNEPTSRSNKLLNMVKIEVPVINNKHITKRRIKGLQMSPSTGRIKKLMSRFSAVANNAEKDELKIETQDMLTFSREVPSPLATPRNSILKRKLDCGGDESAQPATKRKRVNFSDPTTTSKKLFFKYKDEFLNNFEKCHLSAKILFNGELDEDEEETEAQTIDDDDDSSPVQNSEVINEVEIISENSVANTESPPATQDSLKLENATLLETKKPIYFNLVDCDDDILPVLRKVTSPMFVTSLMKDLHKKNVKTIGDIAKLSESEINRLPFKSPPVEVVFKALDDYYNRTLGIASSTSSSDHPNNDETNGSPKSNKTARNGNKNSPEVSQLPYEIKTADVAKWFDKATTSEVDEVKKLLSKPTTFSILNNQELPELIASEIRKSGLEKTVQTINNKSMECSEEECLTEIKTCLEKLILSNNFSKPKVIQNCLEPFVESSEDVSGCLNKLATEEIEKVLIDRVQVPALIERLKQITNESAIADCLNKEEIIRSCSQTVVINALLSDSEKITGFFEQFLSSVDDNHQILIDTFKFISNKLPLKVLAELHVDLVKKIADQL